MNRKMTSDRINANLPPFDKFLQFSRATKVNYSSLIGIYMHYKHVLTVILKTYLVSYVTSTNFMNTCTQNFGL